MRWMKFEYVRRGAANTSMTGWVEYHPPNSPSGDKAENYRHPGLDQHVDQYLRGNSHQEDDHGAEQRSFGASRSLRTTKAATTETATVTTLAATPAALITTTKTPTDRANRNANTGLSSTPAPITTHRTQPGRLLITRMPLVAEFGDTLRGG
jgi:hypothetical protein